MYIVFLNLLLIRHVYDTLWQYIVYFIAVVTIFTLTLLIQGVTLLAFGNGAPDVFSAIAAIKTMKNGDTGVAMGALLGKIPEYISMQIQHSLYF